jgi:hypothetical protein
MAPERASNVTMIEEFVDWLLEWITKISPSVTVLGVIITIIFALRRKILFKILRYIKKERLLTCVVIINDLLDDIDMKELPNILVDFRKSHVIDMHAKEVLVDLKNIIVLEKDVQVPLRVLLSEDKSKAEIALIKNKKVWNEIRKDGRVQKALESVLNIFYERLKLQALASNQKVNTKGIKESIEKITSKQNIMMKRKMRFKIETYNEKKRRKEEIKKKDAQMKALHDKFK